MPLHAIVVAFFGLILPLFVWSFDALAEADSAEPILSPCEAVLSGKPLVKARRYTGGWSDLWNTYRSNAQSPLNTFNREPLPEYMIEELKFKEVIDSGLTKNETFRTKELNLRLRYEFSNPLSNINDIYQRQKDLSSFVANKKIQAAFENLKTALLNLDLFSMAVYNDPLFSSIGLRLIRFDTLEFAQDGGYFFNLNQFARSHKEQEIQDFSPKFQGLPRAASGLGIYLASTQTLKNLLRFDQSDLQKFEPVRHAFLNMAQALSEENSSLYRRLAQVFRVAADPDLIGIDQESLSFFSGLFPSNRRYHQQVSSELHSKARMNVLVATLIAVDELNILTFMSGLREHGKFCFPEFVTRPKPRVKIEQLHHPYWWSINPQKSVANSTDLDGEAIEAPAVLILQGPNRRGKSTYKEALAWAQLMARSGYVVMAKKMTTTLLEPVALFHTKANYSSSDSMFSAQARAGKNLLDRTQNSQSRQTFFLIDEIFGGTTYRQQLAAMQTFLEFARRTNQIGIVTTQNPDARNLRLPGVELIHNSSDYTINQGPSTEEDNNAPEVMEEVGYSAEFIRRMRELLK